jgi:hypothetical protein
VRILAFIAAMLGVAGAAFAAHRGTKSIREADERIESIEQCEAEGWPQPEFGPQLTPEQLRNFARSEREHRERAMRLTYGLLAAVPLGVIGGSLVLVRRGKIAAVLLFVAYAVPLLVAFFGLKTDADNKDIQALALLPVGLAVAGLLSLFVRSGTPHRKPRRGGDIPDDADMVG